MKFIYSIFAILLLSACTNSAELTREHNDWKQKLERLPIGANETQIKQWAESNQIPLVWHQHDHYYWAQKAVNSWWCSQFVGIKIEVNEQQLVTKKDSNQYGKCGF